MADLSKVDLLVRLQLSGQKYSELVSKYIDYIRFGKKDNVLKNKLVLLDIYIELLLNYKICTCDTDCTNNCITEEQAQLICDKISKLTNLCFQPIGFNYQGTGIYSGIGSMEIGCDFEVN